ncbi:MAG: histidine--tRNA ligase [Bacilli bacterium]|nr:histidine--tRNA ligase [Bacilli bacterium]
MKIQNVKGGYDFLPKEQKIRDYINNIIINNFKKFGFANIETPILCYYDMLSDKYDENNDILKEIYRLTDQGNRDLGLRYDLTVPFAKFIALNKNKISFPFKRYEISKVFRDGPVKVGRDREFTQCDADVVGIKGQYIEAELLSLFVKTFKELNIDIIIKYNSRKLMTGLIIESGISEELVSEATTIIDKKDKLKVEEFNQMLFDLDLTEKQIERLNKYFQMDLSKLNEIFKNTDNEKIQMGLKEVNNLDNYLKQLELNCCNFDVTLARGQNYYTGNVFEVYDKKERIRGSIAAGGRYDEMIGNFIGDGEEYPTVGISFGLSAIYELLKKGLEQENSNTDIFIIPMGTETESLKIANQFRENGYNVDIEMNKRKLKKSLDYANREKIKYVIIIGTEEISSNKLKIKNMDKGIDILVDIDKINSLKL